MILTCLVSSTWVYFPLGILGSSPMGEGQVNTSQPLWARAMCKWAHGREVKAELQSHGHHTLESPCLELTFPPDYYFIQVLSFTYQGVECSLLQNSSRFLFQTHLLKEAFLHFLPWPGKYESLLPLHFLICIYLKTLAMYLHVIFMFRPTCWKRQVLWTLFAQLMFLITVLYSKWMQNTRPME